jgi:hypothetical protein
MSSMEQNRAWPSKAESARNAHEAAQKARQKEGGLWNFLTWAFFISQTLGGDQFIGAAAAATAEGDPQARKGDGSDEVAKNPGFGQPTGTRTDAGEEAPGAAGQSHATYADLPELSAVGRAPAEQSSAGAVQQAAYEDAESNGPGGGGGSTPADNPSLPGAPAAMGCCRTSVLVPSSMQAACCQASATACRTSSMASLTMPFCRSPIPSPNSFRR